jgi:hypothetical protein
MDLLSITATAEEIASNPYVVAQRTDAKLKMWLDFKFDEFMTRDHLFTIANLKTLQGDMRKDAMTRVLEKAHQLKLGKDGDSSDETLEYTDMPLYSALVRYERTVSETSTFQRGKGSAPNRGKTQQMDASALEQAAAATEGFKKKKSAEGPYSREVTRDEELWTTQGNFRYLATLKPCPECKKQSGGEHSRPRCFTGQCKVCVVTLVIVDRIASTLLGLIGLGVVAGSPDLTMVTYGTLLELHLERRAPVTGRHHQ